MIVSASRRCDIPAHYLGWLLARIEAGYCLVRNPFDARSVRRVSLDPAEMDCLVLWTRDPRPLADRGGERLEDLGVRSLVHVTLTGYPRSLEPGVPRPDEVLTAFARLSERLGSERVLWRYDPILIAGGLGAEFHLRNFAALAAALEGRTKRVTLSLVDEYARTGERITRSGFPDPLFARPRPPAAGKAPVRAAGAAAASPDGARAGGPAGGPAEGRMPCGLFEPARERGQRPSPAGPPALRLPPEPYASLLASLASIAAARGMRCVSCAEPFDL
ncbi:MAG: DUF1848 family protein, partial [Treponema sp.]|nr:DUF1848 family protein [Treponema sp.]